ncbi:GAF and ANTAR domain-containing protein [Kineococcus sp. SYSU DK005]|uniref:GAF and ANTAR domain-containing protein n=1 Tax=Kineococcus sp. SYSU DK005 TaxID=3383126 RepID=UPI003D7E9C61
MPVAVRAVAAAVDEVAGLLAGRGGPLDLADGLVRHCGELLGAGAVGVLVEDSHGRLRLLASTSGAAAELELLQLEDDEGPCRDCHRAGEPVGCADPAELRRRWPGLAPAAQRHGVLSLHAEPLAAGGRTFGAVGVFLDREGGLDEVERAVVRALASLGAVGLTQLERVAAGQRVQEQLQRALDSRVVLEQAKGVLAERHGVPPEVAFERLRATARTGRRRLHDVAREVVEGAPGGAAGRTAS